MSITMTNKNCGDAVEQIVNYDDTVEISFFNVIEPSFYLNLKIDFAWSERIFKVLKEALNAQYQLACLSTLGGAYHLCNRPVQALALARQQEIVGRYAGAGNIVFRARVYQAINLGLLGKFRKCRAILSECFFEAQNLGEQYMFFWNAAEIWLRNETNRDILLGSNLLEIDSSK
eukprot:gene9096-18844_t